MMKRERTVCNSKGFSLVELIIVIAIMAILAGALTPALIRYIEKSRRSKDITNAKTIEDVLVNAYADGVIEIPEGARKDVGYGVWVMLCNNSSDKAPNPYHGKTFSGAWCGADQGVIIDGKESPNDWSYCNELADYLKKENINVDTLRTYSRGDSDGWDWIIIQLVYDSRGRFCSRIYSGYSNQDGGINNTSETNIEKALNRSWTPLTK